MSSIGIIVIDSNLLLCDLLCALTIEYTRAVWLGAAYTLAEGKRLTEKVKPRIVVLDTQLPDGDGWDFVKWALNEIPNPPRILIMLGRLDERSLVSATRFPVAGIVNKPKFLS